MCEETGTGAGRRMAARPGGGDTAVRAADAPEIVVNAFRRSQLI
jgi:hypothetical protein